MISAAGSLPGDLHKLWKTKNSKGFHLEYGNSCMGYEVLEDWVRKWPSQQEVCNDRDGSYLMLAQEIVTSIQENFKLTIILINNHGYKSIGSLSRSLGSGGYGTRFLYRNEQTGIIDGDETNKSVTLPVNLASNAKSLGAYVIECKTFNDIQNALIKAKSIDKTTVIYTECDRHQDIEGHAWWEVSISEVSKMKNVQKAYKEYIKHKKNQKFYY